jgi:hypothetical protein
VNDKDKKQKKVKYPEGKEVIIIGGLKSFRDYEIKQEMARLEDALLEANKEFIKLRNLIYLHFE